MLASGMRSCPRRSALLAAGPGEFLLALLPAEGPLLDHGSALNAMVLAVLVLGLPKEEQKKALRYGILGAFAFRGNLNLPACVHGLDRVDEQVEQDLPQ